MKPLFGLPGICAFPFFLGILSGYPMGAKITETGTYDDGEGTFFHVKNSFRRRYKTILWLSGGKHAYPVSEKRTSIFGGEEKLLTKEDARHVLVFSNNPGPLFLVGTVGAAFFHAPFWGYALLLLERVTGSAQKVRAVCHFQQAGTDSLQKTGGNRQEGKQAGKQAEKT